MAQDMKIPHSVTLENKEHMHITGVTDVDTLDEQKITIYTEDDTLIIEGDDLHIQKLDVANGILEITGIVCSLVYTGLDAARSQKGFFRRMLK